MIHPTLLRQMARARTEDLRRAAAESRGPGPKGARTAEPHEIYPADPEGALRALAEAGCTTLVALNGSTVVARVQLQSEGERLLVVRPPACSA